MLRFYKIRLVVVLLLAFLALKPHFSFSQCSITNLNASYCLDDAGFALTGGTTYYGPGITGSTFTPSSAGVGTHQIVSTSGSATTYTVNTAGTFSPIAGAGTPIVLANDAITGDIAIGFTFNFFGNNYTNFRAVSNGYIRFSGMNSSATPQAVPNGGIPSNLVAFAWDDLDPSAGGTIQYFVSGTSPYRKLIINYTNIPFAADNSQAGNRPGSTA